MLLRVYVNAAATSLMHDKSSSYCIEAVLTQDQVNTSIVLPCLKVQVLYQAVAI